MNLEFTRQNNELILIYTPEDITIQRILDELEKNGNWTISKCFQVRTMNLRNVNVDENELRFCIGDIQEDYTKISKTVVGVNHDFFFSNKIQLKKRHFIASRNISILAKLNKVIEKDVWIGGNHADGNIPEETFELLLKTFPTSTELDYYAHARISEITKEFFPESQQHELKFKRYQNQKEKHLQNIHLNSDSEADNIPDIFQENADVAYENFKKVRSELNNLLELEPGVGEKVWQKKINGIFRILHPKYIAAIRESKIKGVDAHDKQPDFLLIDANGYIDILEIKKPSVQILTTHAVYRNNHVPLHELAGSIQQIEKYIYCLNAWGKEGEKKLGEKLKDKLPESVTPKIVNPQGILLLGRSNQFNKQQKDDFELIKRQYKHITEIITYDDLMQRIDNIIDGLQNELNVK